MEEAMSKVEVTNKYMIIVMIYFVRISVKEFQNTSKRRIFKRKTRGKRLTFWADHCRLVDLRLWILPLSEILDQFEIFDDYPPKSCSAENRIKISKHIKRKFVLFADLVYIHLIPLVDLNGVDRVKLNKKMLSLASILLNKLASAIRALTVKYRCPHILQPSTRTPS